MQLRFKILLLLLPLTIIPLFAMGWVAYGELRQLSEEKSFGRMVDSLEHIKSFSDTRLKTAVANINLFAKHLMVKKYVLTQDETERYTLMQGALLRAFGSFQEAFPQYYEVRILLPDGYEDIRLSNRDAPNTTEEEGATEFFKAMAAGGGAVQSGVYLNPDNGAYSLYVGKPLLLRDAAIDPIGRAPSLRGYLVITVDLGDLAQLIADARIGRTGYLFATRNTGEALFGSALEGVQDHLTPETVRRILNADAAGPPPRASFGGEKVYVLGEQVFPDLYLFAVQPGAELRQTSFKLALVVATLTLLAIVATTTALFFTLQHFILKPVQTLQGMSREIGQGRLQVKNTLKSKDEIGELARALEDMAGNLQRSDEQIRFIAYHDSLTGLPNRAMFAEYLNQTIADSRRNHRQFALLYLDIDDFKRINDTLGHQAGDRLLQEATDRLSATMRQSDYVARMESDGARDEILARLGGDEFVILLPDIQGPHAPGSLAARLLAALAEPFSFDDHDFYISASIGITLYPADGDNAETLTKNADIAMYHAKGQGKNDYQFYAESMNVLAHERLALENKLRKALGNGELCLYYQPQVEPRSGRIVGLEALMRWRHPEEGMIPPNLFIPVAEESGLILPLGEWVINEACRQCREWHQEGLPVPRISINVSGHQFAKQDVAGLLATAINKYRLAPNYLEVEITEGAIMDQPERAVKVLAGIKRIGVSVALDDFGTGYSSFSYLHRFPIDTLKIDRSFILDIASNGKTAELVAAIIAMAHILKLQVVAEGIETNAQLEALVDKDCDVVQGFLFKAPVPATEVPELLQSAGLMIA